MRFQGYLREWMERRGITRKEAAKLLGVSERMIYFYLQGRKPTPEMAFHIAHITGIPIEVIFDHNHTPPHKVPIFVRF